MRRLLLAALLSVLLPNSVYSVELGEQSIAVAIKGGVSLGSYEAGLNWVLTEELHRGVDAATGEGPLKVFAGTSAGAVNTIISLLSYCRSDSELAGNTYLDNAYLDTWDVGIRDLLPVKGEESDKQKSDLFIDRGSIFSRRTFIEKVKSIHKTISTGSFVEGCSLSITLSVTKFNPAIVKLRGHDGSIKVARFIFPLLASVESGNLIFRNNYRSNRSPADSIVRDRIQALHHIYLPTDRTGVIAPQNILRVVLASSAFPVAFSPVKLQYCLSRLDCENKVYRVALFSDGGIFDNAPIGAAMEFMEFDTDQSRVIYIDPSNVRTDSYHEDDSAGTSSTARLGLADYGTYLARAADIGMNQEFYRALVELSRKKAKLKITDRRFPLVGNYHAHFAAFYARDFRIHDYLVGIHDGLSNLATIKCDSNDSGCADLVGPARDRQLLEYYDEYLGSHIVYRAEGVTGEPACETDGGLEAGPEFTFVCYLRQFEYLAGSLKSVPADLLTKNAYVAISDALTIGPQSSLNQIVNSPLEFGEFAEELRALRAGAYKAAPFDESTVLLLDHSDEWIGDTLQAFMTNLVSMQAETCNCDPAANELNEAIGIVLAKSQPIVNSIVAKQKTDNWPLSAPLFGTNMGLYYGWDFRESAHVVTWRPFRLGEGSWTFELPITTHFLSPERDSDHYVSTGMRIMKHLDGFDFSSLEFGFDWAAPGAETYKESLLSSTLSLGILGNWMRITWQHRIEDIDNSFTVENRTRGLDLFMLQLDVYKTLKLIL